MILTNFQTVGLVPVTLYCLTVIQPLLYQVALATAPTVASLAVS